MSKVVAVAVPSPSKLAPTGVDSLGGSAGGSGPTSAYAACQQGPKEDCMQDRIIVQLDAGVASLTFNRPERLNAMTIETWQLMGRHLADLSRDRTVRCLVLAGAGRAFL